MTTPLLTIETLDDEDLRALRSVAIYFHEPLVMLTCTVALGQDPHASKEDRAVARARCVEIINARRT